MCGDAFLPINYDPEVRRYRPNFELKKDKKTLSTQLLWKRAGRM